MRLCTFATSAFFFSLLHATLLGRDFHVDAHVHTDRTDRSLKQQKVEKATKAPKTPKTPKLSKAPTTPKAPKKATKAPKAGIKKASKAPKGSTASPTGGSFAPPVIIDAFAQATPENPIVLPAETVALAEGQTAVVVNIAKPLETDDIFLLNGPANDNNPTTRHRHLSQSQRELQQFLVCTDPERYGAILIVGSSVEIDQPGENNIFLCRGVDFLGLVAVLLEILSGSAPPTNNPTPALPTSSPTPSPSPFNTGVSLMTVAVDLLGDCVSASPVSCGDDRNAALEWFLYAANHDGSVTEAARLKERLILAIVYIATNTAMNGSWLTEGDHCNWGIRERPDYQKDSLSCTDGFVTGLENYDGYLEGTIPPEIGGLSALKELDYGMNNIGGTIPSAIGDLTNLEILNLHYNKLTGAVPSEIGSLSNLVELDLSYNSFTGVIPGEVMALCAGSGISCELPVLTTNPTASPTSTPTEAPTAVPTVIGAGPAIQGQLVENQRYYSPDRQTSLIFQGDGNLVLYVASNNPVWNSGTYRNVGVTCEMQSNGNLMITDSGNDEVWSSGTSGNANAYLSVLNSGQFGIFQSDGTLIKKFPDREIRGGLNMSERYYSPDGQTRLVFQGDGNLVLYDATDKALWNSGTGGRGVTCEMQSNGNLMITDSGNDEVWSSGTSGNANAYLSVLNSGQFGIYQSDGTLIKMFPPIPTAAPTAVPITESEAPTAVPTEVAPTESPTESPTVGGGGPPLRGALIMREDYYSPDGQTRLNFASDGNLALYDTSINPLWSSGTGGVGWTCEMRADGNLVIISSSGNIEYWSSGTSGNANAYLSVLNSGHFGIYQSDGTLIKKYPSS